MCMSQWRVAGSVVARLSSSHVRDGLHFKDTFKFNFVYPTLFTRDKKMCLYYSCATEKFM